LIFSRRFAKLRKSAGQRKNPVAIETTGFFSGTSVDNGFDFTVSEQAFSLLHSALFMLHYSPVYNDFFKTVDSE